MLSQGDLVSPFPQALLPAFPLSNNGSRPRACPPRTTHLDPRQRPLLKGPDRRFGKARARHNPLSRNASVHDSTFSLSRVSVGHVLRYTCTSVHDDKQPECGGSQCVEFSLAQTSVSWWAHPLAVHMGSSWRDMRIRFIPQGGIRLFAQ